MNTIYAALTTPLQQTRVDIFEGLFNVFLGLGTLVGVVVVTYILYNAYKYRDVGDDEETDDDRPVLGELPTGGKGGKKLFLSFFLSAIIVISLVAWSYVLLLDVEAGGNPDDDDAVEIEVEGQTFSWRFVYPDQDTSEINNMIVPADRTIEIQVTSIDVWHAFGLPQERVKADAIPGEYDETWFVADETGEYEDAIKCFELCGDQHSGMTAQLTVVDGELYDAIVEEDAMGEFVDGLGDGELTVDSSPEELTDYVEMVEEEEAEEEEDTEEDEGEEDTEEDETEEEEDTEEDETDEDAEDEADAEEDEAEEDGDEDEDGGEN